MPIKYSAGEVISPIAQYEDRVLIQMAIAGRSDCFSLLMHRHIAAVKKHLRFAVRNEADLEDLVQEVVLRVWLHLATFRSESKLRTWMIRIGLNEARQSYRRSQSRPISQPITDTAAIVSKEESPHQRLHRTETIETVRRAVAELPHRYREVVTLRYLRELGERETAQCLQMTLSAVKTRLFRARLMLSAELPKSSTLCVDPDRAEVSWQANSRNIAMQAASY